jgi:hypothetical protein
MSDEEPKILKSPLPCRTPWPLRIEGHDEHGHERVIALDWDGKWHDLSPKRTQAALTFTIGQFAKRGDMVLCRTSDDSHSRGYTTWATPGGGSVYVSPNEHLEPWVARTQRADVSLGQVVFAADDDDGLLVDADTEMEVAP